MLYVVTLVLIYIYKHTYLRITSKKMTFGYDRIFNTRKMYLKQKRKKKNISGIADFSIFYACAGRILGSSCGKSYRLSGMSKNLKKNFFFVLLKAKLF